MDFEQHFIKDTKKSIIEKNKQTHKIINKDDLIIIYPKNNIIKTNLNGIIMDISTHKLICWNYPTLIKSNQEKLNNITYFELTEGTYLRFYNYCGNWFIASNKIIDCDENKFKYNDIYPIKIMKKYFGDNYESFLKELNPDYSYGFILSDPTISKYSKLEKTTLTHVMTYDNINKKELFNVEIKYTDEMKEVKEHTKDNKIGIDLTTSQRYIILSEEQTKKEKLIGNFTNKEFIILKNWKNKTLDELIKFYPDEYKPDYILRKIDTLSRNILTDYYIMKNPRLLCVENDLHYLYLMEHISPTKKIVEKVLRKQTYGLLSSLLNIKVE